LLGEQLPRLKLGALLWRLGRYNEGRARWHNLVVAEPGGEVRGDTAPIQVNLLGPFLVALEGRRGGPWARPVAKRLCGLILVSPGRRITRVAACDALFPNLAPPESARGLSKAIAMAHAALAPLGEPGKALLQADRAHVWASRDYPIEVDWEVEQAALRSALDTRPGLVRDDLLTEAVANEEVLLEDEPSAEWAATPREHHEWARQEARLTLARDRARGFGRSRPADVVSAWDACLTHDPTCEEATCALMRLHSAQKRPALVEVAYERCRSAVEELGLKVSPALQEVHGVTTSASNFPDRPSTKAQPRFTEERRLVSVVFVELTSPLSGGRGLAPEDAREVIGGALAQVFAQVEALGGTVTSVSGAGLVALFGAPESHEDDPERALRAAFRAVAGAGLTSRGLSLRAGVETGAAVVGPIESHAFTHYGAVGEVVVAAAALQSVAAPASVLVGPATRAATEGLFEWGPSEEVVVQTGGKPLEACYLGHPKARPTGQSSRRRLAGSVPLVGRDREMSVVRNALREVTSGTGSVLLMAGEPGLGKTRLVHECRKLFLAWAGATSGRLPLWLEGRAGSYTSSQPFGLFQQLLSAWVGAAPEADEGRALAALDRAMKAAFGPKTDDAQVGLLAQVMGLRSSAVRAPASRLSPEQLQRARFKAFVSLLSRLVAHGPTLVVLEDLHWADPTSLRLSEEIASLTVGNPLLLVLTRRPEPDPGVSALEAALSSAPNLSLRKIELTPLGDEAERDLVNTLLGGVAGEDVSGLVRQGAEGNPLFLEERFASLMEAGALVNTGDEHWRLERDGGVELPEAIERLVRARVDRLAPGPREAIVAASVLGPEFTLDALKAVTERAGELLGAVSELCSAGLLVEAANVPEAILRFRHTLIQEATYKGLLRGQRARLHSRAAWGLEQASAGRLEEVAGLLGHHYALGGEAERAAHYLALAGDRAASTFGNEEARASYSWAIELLGPDPAHAVSVAEIWLKLGRLAWRLGRFEDSRAAFERAAALASDSAILVAARSLCLLAAVETADHRHDAARGAIEAAEEELRISPDQGSDEWAEIWVDVQLERSNLHYWRNEPAAQALVLERARPVVESQSKPKQKANFYSAVTSQRLRASRYLIDDSLMLDYRKAWQAVVDAGLENELFYVRFQLGFGLLWYGDFTEAHEHLEQTLEISRRAEDKTLELRVLTYLCCAHLRQHNVEQVKALAPDGEALAAELGFPEYAGMAKAMLAWAAWKEDRYVDAEALAEEARELWRACSVHYSWCWAGLWPLVAVQLDDGRLENAVAAARELLGPDQQRFPEELESAVGSALDTWDRGDEALAAKRLSWALELACRLRYA
jgi:class 3 adenylate cyclase/tetratricopeptide (TPR) repeat protein